MQILGRDGSFLSRTTLFPWAPKSDLDIRPLSRLLASTITRYLDPILSHAFPIRAPSTVSHKGTGIRRRCSGKPSILVCYLKTCPEISLETLLALQYLPSWLKRGQTSGKVRVAFISERRALPSIFIQSFPLPLSGYYLSLELPSGLNPVKSSVPGLSSGNPFLHLRSPNTTLT